MAPLPLPYRSRRLGSSPVVPAAQRLEVAPLNLRRRGSTSSPNTLDSGQEDFETRPLRTTNAAGSPTVPRPTVTTSTSNTSSIPAEAESALLSLLADNTAFNPQVSPPRAIVFEEETSPKVINKRLRTGHVITVTPPADSPSESETKKDAHHPTYSYRCPPDDTGINPEFLRVSHTTGKASDFWYRNVAGFPVIGEAPEVTERSWEDAMADDDSLRVPPLNIVRRESSEKATTTPPNTAVSLPAESERLIPANVAVETGSGNPIAEDLTPSYWTPGSPAGGSDRPVSEQMVGSQENTSPIVTVAPDQTEASQNDQVQATPKAQATRNPQNPPPPPLVPPSTFISSDNGVGRLLPNPFVIVSPPDPALVAPPNQTHRPPEIDFSRSTASTNQPSPPTTRISSGRGTFSGDRGRGYSERRKSEKVAQAARDEALGLNSRELLPTPACPRPQITCLRLGGQ